MIPSVILIDNAAFQINCIFIWIGDANRAGREGRGEGIKPPQSKPYWGWASFLVEKFFVEIHGLSLKFHGDTIHCHKNFISAFFNLYSKILICRNIATRSTFISPLRFWAKLHPNSAFPLGYLRVVIYFPFWVSLQGFPPPDTNTVTFDVQVLLKN